MWGFLIGLFTFMILPSLRVDASVNMSLSGESSVAPGGTVKYAIVLNNDNKDDLVNYFTTTVTFDSQVLTLTAIEPGTGWKGNTEGGSSGKTITYEKTSGDTGKFTVATLVFKVKSELKSNSATISLTVSKYRLKTDEEAPDAPTTDQSLDDMQKKLNIKSTDNTLSSLKVNSKSVEGFSSNKTEYDITVESDVSSAKIAATTNSSKATLKSGSGNRTVSLNYGANTFNVIVVSESGSEKTYKLNITREDTRSTDATLSSITVNGEPLKDFKSTTYKYTIKQYKASVADVVGIANDEKAKVAVNKSKTIVIGENTYTIVVTSEKGDTATYTLVINNVDNVINKKLKTLSVKGYNIEFDRNNNRYEITYNKNKFKNLHIYYTLMAESDEAYATMEPDINNDSTALSKLKVGDEITITVTGIDGESSEYTITVVKDNRISFFLVLELFLIVVVIAIIIVVAIKKKHPTNKGKKNSQYKTKVVVKEKKKEPASRSAVPIVEDERPKKKKRFSIYEDEYEEVEVEIEDDDDEYSTTKELTDEELNLK